MASRVESRDYLQMSLDRPADTRRERACFRHILSGLPRLASVLELFGGAGVFHDALIDLDRLAPDVDYEAWDLSPKCVAHLAARYPTARAMVADSFTQAIPPGRALISADFNTWTFYKRQTRADYAALTDRLFSAGASWIQLTDASAFGLHLNRARYAEALGVELPTLEGLCARCR